MATIKDVAKEAGVSVATVSNYLNRTTPVSKKRAKAIQDAIERLKYSHNVLARNVRTRRNMDIGVILPDLDNSYYVQLFQGIKSYFQNTEYSINVEFSRNIPEFERSIAEKFLEKQVCGLILMSCQPDDWKFYYDNFTSRNIPLVLLDRNIHDLDTNYVSFDYYSMTKKMTEELLEKGNKEIYLVTGPNKYTCEAECVRGFVDACEAYGVEFSNDKNIQTDMSKENAFRKITNLFKEKSLDAVVTTAESLAIGVIEGLTVLKGDISDIQVATFGEEHWNHHTHSFSSAYVERAAIEMGRVASRLLERQMAEMMVAETEKIILKEFRIGKKPNIIHNKKDESIEKKKIRVLLLDSEQGEALRRLIQNFENATGIEVETVSVNYHYIYDEIMDSYLGNVPSYDVVMYALAWLPVLSSKHVLADITNEAKALEHIFFENSLEHFGHFKGRYYGVPFLYGPQILYYRKNLFEDPILKAEYEKVSSISLRPPKTFKEYNTIADFFTNKTDVIPYGITISAEFNACLVQEIYMRMLAFGAKVFDDKGNVCFNSERTLKAYINFARATKYADPAYRQTNDTSALSAFMRGDVAMLITYPTNLTEVTDLRRHSVLGSIGYHIVPGQIPLLGGWGLGVNSKSQNKREAKEFLRWTCDEQVASYMTLLGGQTAVTSACTNNALTDLYPWLELYHSMNQWSKPMMPPLLSNGQVIPQSEIDDVICKWVYQMLDHDMEVTDVIKNTHGELEQLVERYLNIRK